MGRDPKHEAGGFNLYGFVRNNTVNLWDFLGMNPSAPPLRLKPVFVTTSNSFEDEIAYQDYLADLAAWEAEREAFLVAANPILPDEGGGGGDTSQTMVANCKGLKASTEALMSQYASIADRFASRKAVYDKMLSADVSVSALIDWGDEAWEAFFPIAGLYAKTPVSELVVGALDGTLNMAKSGVDQKAVGFAKALLTAIVSIGAYTGQLSADISSKASPFITGAEALAFGARVLGPLQASSAATVDQDRLWRQELATFRDSAETDLSSHVKAMEETAKLFRDYDCETILGRK